MRDGVERLLPSKVSLTLRRGDLVRIVTPGAAGWGPPLERDPQRVLADVRAEKLSVAAARRIYGVVIDPTTLCVDEPATGRARRRRTMRARSGAARRPAGRSASER